MNILTISLPDGLHSTRCSHANQYENWLSEEHAFHSHRSQARPCNFVDTQDTVLPENGWYSCIHHESNSLYSYAMRCAVVRSPSGLGSYPARSYTVADTQLLARRQVPPSFRPLSYISADDHKGARYGRHCSSDTDSKRHNAATCQDCQNPEESLHPANGDLCLIMQLHTHAEFDQCPDYAPVLQQFMVVTRVLAENSVSCCYGVGICWKTTLIY